MYTQVDQAGHTDLINGPHIVDMYYVDMYSSKTYYYVDMYECTSTSISSKTILLCRHIWVHQYFVKKHVIMYTCMGAPAPEFRQKPYYYVDMYGCTSTSTSSKKHIMWTYMGEPAPELRQKPY
jgi:hypothetical protein